MARKKAESPELYVTTHNGTFCVGELTFEVGKPIELTEEQAKKALATGFVRKFEAAE